MDARMRPLPDEAVGDLVQGFALGSGQPNHVFFFSPLRWIKKLALPIVAATAMLQVFRFPQPSGLKVVEISRLFPRTHRVSVNKTQASRYVQKPIVLKRHGLRYRDSRLG
jgi:hypothetical protein